MPPSATPWWLFNGHVQTIVPALWAKWRWAPPVCWKRERWESPDGDFIEVDVSRPDAAHQGKPLLVLFHGLEGSSSSHYAKAFAAACQGLGWACAVPHFRGCSGVMNRLPRAYHSGDHEEIDWVLRRFRSTYLSTPVVAVGISLGGNALARWAGEQGAGASGVVKGLACICSPLDLVASGLAMGSGLNRHIYTRMFLKTMVPKALHKLEQHPGLFSAKELLAATDLQAFDEVFTAPLHGFAGAMDYWQRASAKPLLGAVGVPMLLVNALNDPFVPPSSLPTSAEVSKMVSLWQPAQGGHVGFASRRPDSMAQQNWLMPMPKAVLNWLSQRVS